MGLLLAPLSEALERFVRWLECYGEMSFDHQSVCAGRWGGAAKSLCYRHRHAGTAAVAPMVLAEAFLLSARRVFHNSVVWVAGELQEHLEAGHRHGHPPSHHRVAVFDAY